jgi:hypothetical protein
MPRLTFAWFAADTRRGEAGIGLTCGFDAAIRRHRDTGVAGVGAGPPTSMSMVAH